MRRRFFTADVFTDRAFGGNPVAVLPDGSGIPSRQMQQIAREMNLSETVFVLPPESPDHTRRLRIFTPTTEMAFAGHPTLGTAFVLAATGAISLDGEQTRIVFEEGVGPVPVRIEARGGRPVRTQLEAAQPPEHGPPPPAPEAIAAAVSLDPGDLLVGAEAPHACSCGMPYLFVPLRDRQALARARLDHGAWERGIAKYWAPSLYLYTRDAAAGFDVRARMFAPGHGVDEDPATGSAAAAFAGIVSLAGAEPDSLTVVVIEQGVEMGRPSRLELEVEIRGGEVHAARVAGDAVLVSEGTMEIPDAG